MSTTEIPDFTGQAPRAYLTVHPGEADTTEVSRGQYIQVTDSWGGQVALEVAINWPETMMAFEKIGYDGVLMFEVKNTSTAAAVLERAARARRRLESLAGSWELEAGSSS